MPTLDLYKPRKFNSVKLFDKKSKTVKTYKIPSEFTVEEVERLLEIELLRLKIEKTPASKDKSEQDKQVEKFWQVTFDELEMLFQHFQPDMTAQDLRESLTYDDALELIGFYHKYRMQGAPVQTGGKKKL